MKQVFKNSNDATSVRPGQSCGYQCDQGVLERRAECFTIPQCMAGRGSRVFLGSQRQWPGLAAWKKTSKSHFGPVGEVGEMLKG